MLIQAENLEGSKEVSRISRSWVDSSLPEQSVLFVEVEYSTLKMRESVIGDRRMSSIAANMVHGTLGVLIGRRALPDDEEYKIRKGRHTFSTQ